MFSGIADNKIFLKEEQLADAAMGLAQFLKSSPNFNVKPIRAYGVPNGGLPVAALLAHYGIKPVFTPHGADIIVDDLIDSGATYRRYKRDFPSKPFYALCRKGDVKTCAWQLLFPAAAWLVFPWENSAEQDTSAHDICTRLLQYIGEDFRRPGLLETPERFIKAWQEITTGYRQDPAALVKAFEDGAEGVDEMVVQLDIPFYSMCEHHMLPFFGKVHIGYIPADKIIGLSKLKRLVDVFSKRLQVQERMTMQIAEELQKQLDPTGVAVTTEARHLCMEMRGISTANAITKSTKLFGSFKEKAETRNEFYQLLKQ